jgi:glucose dehydrogenase
VVVQQANNYGEEAQPLIKDGVIYVTSQDKTVAVDALTGKEIWKTMVEYAPETARVVCCGIVNRGAALYQDRLFRVTLDARVIVTGRPARRFGARASAIRKWASREPGRRSSPMAS